MKTVKLIGGLGNQMFQYALYRAMELKGIDVCLDDYTYFNRQNAPAHLAYHLDIFGLKYNKMDPEKMPRYLVNPQSLLFRLFHKYRFGFPYYFEKEASKYDSSVFNIRQKNKYFEGYWQTDKYFKEYKDIIKQDFQFKGEWSPSNAHYRDMMQRTNSVSLHIRRGDYLKNSVYTGICTEDYYHHAIDYMKKHVEAPSFFVFSNDLEWCKAFFGEGDSVVYVEGNDVEHSYMDMILMTFCKHHVIANSSFSWWGSWLGVEDGVTIAPTRWYQIHETPDIWCDGWIKMD